MSQVYVWGQGALGQLGLGDSDSRDTPCLIESSQEFGSVRQVVAGGCHSLALTETGAVYSWGLGDEGQLGTGTTRNYSTPQLVHGLRGHTVVQIAAGAEHSAALTQKGVYTWGCGADGRLGHGTQTNCVTPTLVLGLRDKQIVQIACGSAHTLALTADGIVYSWGCGDDGQLGLGTEQSFRTPVIIDAFVSAGISISEVCCGPKHNLAVDSRGRLFSWGRGACGRLGTGSEQSENRPCLLDSFDDRSIVQVAAGGSHSVALTDRGGVFTFGSGQHGQLGHGDCFNVLAPRQIEALEGQPVHFVAAGGAHSVCLSRGEMFAWGLGANGALGVGVLSKAVIPQFVDALFDKDISQVSCGASHTIAIDSSSAGYVGAVEFGQVARSVLKAPTSHSRSGSVISTTSRRGTTYSHTLMPVEVSFCSPHDDADVFACQECSTPFTMLTRRHRCRNCNNVFCAECTPKTCSLPYRGYEAKDEYRVCEKCYVVLQTDAD